MLSIENNLFIEMKNPYKATFYIYKVELKVDFS